MEFTTVFVLGLQNDRSLTISTIWHDVIGNSQRVAPPSIAGSCYVQLEHTSLYCDGLIVLSLVGFFLQVIQQLNVTLHFLSTLYIWQQITTNS
jgi:hypothetical protein